MYDIPAPFDLSLDDFLRGLNQRKEVEIDLYFSGSFEEFWQENKEEIESDHPFEQWPILKISDAVEGVIYLDTDSGVVMVDQNRTPIGAYLWFTLCISKDWQGKGLGRELVIVRCSRDEANPVWNADTPAYSPAGFAAHQSAWHAMQ